MNRTFCVDGRTVVVGDDKGDIEYADRGLRSFSSPFPKRWRRRGGLTTSMTDAEVRSWILSQISEDRALGIRPGTRQDEDQWLRDADGEWELRRGVPVDPVQIAAQNRRRKLELLRHGPLGPHGDR